MSFCFYACLLILFLFIYSYFFIFFSLICLLSIFLFVSLFFFTFLSACLSFLFLFILISSSYFSLISLVVFYACLFVSRPASLFTVLSLCYSLLFTLLVSWSCLFDFTSSFYFLFHLSINVSFPCSSFLLFSAHFLTLLCLSLRPMLPAPILSYWLSQILQPFIRRLGCYRIRHFNMFGQSWSTKCYYLRGCQILYTDLFQLTRQYTKLSD